MCIRDRDYADFKKFLKDQKFAFDTETEQAMKKTLEAAKKEKIDEDIKNEVQQLLTALQKSDETQLNKHQAEIKELILDEIIKRYQYKEGLYQYYTKNNSEIKKATALLNNPAEYNKILLK